MKITDIRTIVVGNPWKNWVFVVVETSEGITGLGEATGGLQTMPNKEAVEESVKEKDVPDEKNTQVSTEDEKSERSSLENLRVLENFLYL